MAFIYTDNDGLKKEIKKHQVEKGITAKAVADSMSMLPQTYQSLINKKNFSFFDVKRICDSMGYDLVIDFVPKKEEK